MQLHTLHTLHAACVCTVTVAVLEFLSVHSHAVPSHAMDPANAFAFHGAVGDGRAALDATSGMPRDATGIGAGVAGGMSDPMGLGAMSGTSTMGCGRMGGGSGGVSANMRSSQIHEQLQAVGRLLPSWVVICLRALAKVLEIMVEGHDACPACVHR
jgi:hypothetical protein